MEDCHAFTLKSSGILDMLRTDTLVLSDIRDKTKPYTPKLWRGLWDTGASNSSITQRIVDDLNLIPVGKINSSTANGIVVVNTYFIDLGLPNGVTVKNVLVSCNDLGKDLDILIGMDIIQLGDFSITNKNRKTTFSFRIPSIKEIDYVTEYNEQLTKDKN